MCLGKSFHNLFNQRVCMMHIYDSPLIRKTKLKPKSSYITLHSIYILLEGMQHTQRVRCLDGITDSMALSLSIQEILSDREAWHAAVHAVSKSRTHLSGWTTLTESSERFWGILTWQCRQTMQWEYNDRLWTSRDRKWYWGGHTILSWNVQKEFHTLMKTFPKLVSFQTEVS